MIYNNHYFNMNGIFINIETGDIETPKDVKKSGEVNVSYFSNIPGFKIDGDYKKGEVYINGDGAYILFIDDNMGIYPAFSSAPVDIFDAEKIGYLDDEILELIYQENLEW